MRVRIGVIEMGRKSDCWVGMAILGTGVMLASFLCCATVDVASDMLNRKATCLQNIGADTRCTTRRLHQTVLQRSLDGDTVVRLLVAAAYIVS